MSSMRLLCCSLLLAGVCLAADVPKDFQVVDQIVAKVNGDIITQSDLSHSLRETEAEMKQSGLTGVRLDDALAEKKKDLLRDKIDQLLLVSKAKDLNINVDTELTKNIAQIQSKLKIADPEKFHEVVHEQTGMPYQDFISEMKNNMLTQRVVRQEVGGRINVKQEDIQKYYNEHKKEFIRQEQVFLSEILISTDGKDAAGMAAADKKAKDLVARARKGEKFAQLAEDNSDAITAKQGGDLGALKKGELKSSLETVIWDKPKGYVTDPIRVDNGYLILKVEDHQKAGQATLDDVQNQIMDRLYAPKMQGAMRTYLTQLREQAFLQIKKNYVDTGAAKDKDTTWIDPAQLKPETITKEEVANQKRRKRFLAIPIPGTTASGKSKSQ